MEKKGEPWTDEEDRLLATYQAKYGNKWSHVCHHIQGRNSQSCAQRWRHKVNPEIVRERWAPEEDALLVKLVAEYGVGKWANIARHLPGRTDQQCGGRWRRHLDPSICKDAWTSEEDAKLLALFEQYGKRWSDISKELSNRTPQQCRGRYCALENHGEAKQGLPTPVPRTPRPDSNTRSGRKGGGVARNGPSAGCPSAVSLRAPTELPAMPASATTAQHPLQQSIQTRRGARRMQRQVSSDGPVPEGHPPGAQPEMARQGQRGSGRPQQLARLSEPAVPAAHEGEEEARRTDAGDASCEEAVDVGRAQGRVTVLGRRVVTFCTRARTLTRRKSRFSAHMEGALATPGSSLRVARGAAARSAAVAAAGLVSLTPGVLALDAPAGGKDSVAVLGVVHVDGERREEAGHEESAPQGAVGQEDGGGCVAVGLKPQRQQAGERPARRGRSAAAARTAEADDGEACSSQRRGPRTADSVDDSSGSSSSEDNGDGQPARKQPAVKAPCAELRTEGPGQLFMSAIKTRSGRCYPSASGTSSASEGARAARTNPYPGARRPRSARPPAGGSAEQGTDGIPDRTAGALASGAGVARAPGRAQDDSERQRQQGGNVVDSREQGAQGPMTLERRGGNAAPVSFPGAAADPGQLLQDAGSPQMATSAGHHLLSGSGDSAGSGGYRADSTGAAASGLEVHLAGLNASPAEPLPDWHVFGSPPTSSLLALMQAGNILQTPAGTPRPGPGAAPALQDPANLPGSHPGSAGIPGLPTPSFTAQWSDVPAVSWSEWRRLHGGFGIAMHLPSALASGGGQGAENDTPDNTRRTSRAPDGIRGCNMTPRRDMFVGHGALPVNVRDDAANAARAEGDDEGMGDKAPSLTSPGGPYDLHAAHRTQPHAIPQPGRRSGQRRASADEAMLFSHEQPSRLRLSTSFGPSPGQFMPGGGMPGTTNEPKPLPDFCSPSKKPRKSLELDTSPGNPAAVLPPPLLNALMATASPSPVWQGAGPVPARGMATGMAGASMSSGPPLMATRGAVPAGLLDNLPAHVRSASAGDGHPLPVGGRHLGPRPLSAAGSAAPMHSLVFPAADRAFRSIPFPRIPPSFPTALSAPALPHVAMPSALARALMPPPPALPRLGLTSNALGQGGPACRPHSASLSEHPINQGVEVGNDDAKNGPAGLGLQDGATFVASAGHRTTGDGPVGGPHGASVMPRAAAPGGVSPQPPPTAPPDKPRPGLHSRLGALAPTSTQGSCPARGKENEVG